MILPWFFTAVLTTRIYCRPSCPVVPPKVENMTFYPSAAAAQQAGFRACKRCRPDASPGSPQWNERADLVARAERQQERTQSSPAKRGDIVDRRGRVLATSVDADTIYAVPTEIDDAAAAAGAICAALGDCYAKDRQSMAERLGQKRAFAYVRRQVAPDQAQRVAALNLDGIGFTKESKRFYPNK